MIHSKKHGITLLITLVALLVLATLIVQFELDTHLQIRSSSYRREKLQCLYAAESGMIIGSHLIKEVFKKPVTTSMSSESSALQNDLSALGDPNDPNDPNNWDVSFEPIDENSPFLVYSKTIEVGEATVEIEIHDENAKWPMLWVMASPFENDRSSRVTRERLEKLGSWLETDSEVRQDVSALTQELGRKVKVPTSDVTVSLKKEEAQTKSARRGRTRTVQRKRIGYKKRLAERDTRYQAMGQFAREWQEKIRFDPDYEILKKDMWTEDSFLEYLGIWGNSTINVNMASAEVLQAAFEPMGITAAIANQIVEQRKSQAFSNTSGLNSFLPSDNNLRQAFEVLAVTKSDTYSIHVTARLGRTHKTLIAGAFVDSRGRVKHIATIPGD
jgi:type II secretory pathway component PulK